VVVGFTSTHALRSLLVKRGGRGRKTGRKRKGGKKGGEREGELRARGVEGESDHPLRNFSMLAVW